ncbi:MAG: PIN domain-containing protein [Actinomycetota bacterium]
MLLVDTNIWLVAADHGSARRDEITSLLAGHDWASPTPVIAETAWLILDRLGTGAHQRFLRLVTTGQLDPIELTDTDWQRCLNLVETYADLALDLADAALVAVAERLDQTTIATLNHRDFRVVRPAHCDAFHLVP